MAILLRVLLSLALVLNGAGSAWAMDAHAGATKARHHDGHAIAAEAVVPPCHDDADAGAPHAPDPTPEPADCCRTAACQCACAQLPATALAANPFVPDLPPAAAAMSRTPHGHPAPALPHRTRPPIG